jgi:DNA uptake protein ComE-like DNA-binding protein
VALITALGMLVLFVILGTAFLNYVTIEQSSVRYDVNVIRANAAADGGIRVAMGEIQAQLAAGKPAPKEASPLTFPVYAPGKSKESVLDKSDKRAATAKVTITDECAKINLNQAPVAVLQAILGVNGEKARALRFGLPRQDSGEILAPTSERRWLTTVDDLVTRGLMDGTAYDALDKNLLTVYSVADNANPGSYINLNAAPAKVLAAVLNLTPEAAAAVVAARDKAPFKSLEDLKAAVGKGPSTFNVPQAPGSPDALPSSLAFSSRCFRIHSEAQVTDKINEQQHKLASSAVEAVVYFPDSGAPVVQYWGTAPEQQ